MLKDVYLFLRNWNVEKQEIGLLARRGAQRKIVHINLSGIATLLENRKIVYNNGGTQVLGPR